MKTLSDRFREQARRTPDAIALVFEDESIPYAALSVRVDRFVRDLDGRGVGRGTVVGLHMRHSPDLVVALLAIAQTGAAYVGIDPAWPPARARDVLHDSKPSAIVVDDEDTARTLGFDGGIIITPRAGIQAADVAPVSGSPPASHHHATADDLFNIVYTSGSTGGPKGVLVTLGSVLNKLEWLWSAYPFQPGDVALLYRSYTTAGFTTDCFGALLQGLPTVISHVDAHDANAIIDAAQRGGVTCCGASVGFWETLIDRAERHPHVWPTLRLARSSGAALPPALVTRWRRTRPQVRLLNIYGATECSGSTVYDTSLFDPADATRVPVGRSIPDVEVLVVDDQMRPVGIGESGELCISGASLARGYLGDPDLTRGRFLTHPAGPPGTRVFRTGDIGFLNRDGQIEITGRRDLQVKVRGYRVAMEEVEAALQRCPGVRAAAVRGEEDGGDTRLTAFVLPEAIDGLPPATLTIRRALGDLLPNYMVPAEFILVDDVPRTANGKIDRRALAGLPKDASQPPATVVLSRTPTEQAVAAVWSDVLGLRDIGRDDDFFDVGGHSLSGTQIVSRLEDLFAMAVPLRVLFDNPSIGDLAKEIDRLAAMDASELEPWRPSPAGLEAEIRL